MKKFLLLTFLASLLSLSKAQTFTTVAGGNGRGSAHNQFYSPDGLFVDKSGNLYVSDDGNERIIKFPSSSDSATMGIIVGGGNGQGSNGNQLSRPTSVFGDSIGALYVSDEVNSRIQIFLPGSDSSTIAATFESTYLSDATFIDSKGYIYTIDNSLGKVFKYPPHSLSATNPTVVAANTFTYFNAWSMWVDGQGYIYVTDDDSSRVLRFPPNSDANTAGTIVAGGNGQGGAANQLSSPYSICVDSRGNIYVADYDNNRIQKFPPNSTTATDGVTIAGNGVGSVYLNGPKVVFADDHDNIYIADSYNNRILKLTQPSSGINDIPTPETISIYPNPNSGSFMLSSNNNFGSEYSVHDMLGRIVASGTISSDNQTINIGAHVAGLFTLEIKNAMPVKFVVDN